MNLGTILRGHRKTRKFTLKYVAEKAGISEGFLSQIENNVNSPSVETLRSICSALGINAGDVLNQVEQQDKLVLIRKKEWGDVDIPQSGFVTRRFFPPEVRSGIDTAILVIDPGKSIPVRKNIKNSQEILCVLKGRVELLHDRKTLSLSEGDAAHYWTMPESQMISNKEKARAVVLWIGTL